MTDDEAIELAKIVALGKGWPWIEPVKVRHQKLFIFFGPTVLLDVLSNATSASDDVRVQISDRTPPVVMAERVIR